MRGVLLQDITKFHVRREIIGSACTNHTILTQRKSRIKRLQAWETPLIRPISLTSDVTFIVFLVDVRLASAMTYIYTCTSSSLFYSFPQEHATKSSRYHTPISETQTGGVYYKQVNTQLHNTRTDTYVLLIIHKDEFRQNIRSHSWSVLLFL